MTNDTNVDDGGPAFPVECQYGDGRPVSGVQTGGTKGWETGMTLRDHMASSARASDAYGSDGIPSGIATALMGSECPDYAVDSLAATKWWAEAVAKWRYMAADAMLVARRERTK